MMELSLAPQLSMELLEEAVEVCRFCGCAEDRPCSIALARGDDGTIRLARNQAETFDVIPCGWFLPSVCNRPECIEKLLGEARQRPALYDAFGNQVA